MGGGTDTSGICRVMGAQPKVVGQKTVDSQKKKKEKASKTDKQKNCGKRGKQLGGR